MQRINLIIALLAAVSTAAAQPQAPDTVWTKTFGGAYEDVGRQLINTNDGGFVTIGYSDSFSNPVNEEDVWLFKTDANGNLLWSRTFGGEDTDYGYDVAQTNDNGFIVVGVTGENSLDTQDIWLIKTD